MATHYLIRFSKALLSLSLGLLTLVVVFNNITDYWTNFNFVSHVLSMDTIFAGSKLRSRAIRSARWQHAFYLCIIAWEALVAGLCTLGGLMLLQNLKADTQSFHQAKRFTIAGLLGGVLLWFTGFQVIAGEWFAMWMSKEWDGSPSATRLTQFMLALLIFVGLKNDDA